MNAKAYILYLKELFFGEVFADRIGANNDGTTKEVKILPYESVKQVYFMCVFNYFTASAQSKS